MKNIILFLSLFLLCPAATQCMEKEIVVKPKTIQDIRNKRDAIYKESLDICNNEFDNFVLQNNWPNFLISSKEKRAKEDHEYFYYDFMLQNLYRDDDNDQYSFFGATAIAIKNKKFNPATCFSWVEYKDKREKYLTSEKVEPVSFNEKKKHLQELLTLVDDTGIYYDRKISPTTKDKEFALLEKWERCAPLIIRTYLNLQHSLFLSEINIPREIIPLIILLMWTTEESLL